LIKAFNQSASNNTAPGRPPGNFLTNGETNVNLTWILTGGFAKGYRTYILMGVAVVGAIANYSIGDSDLIQTLTAIASALGVSTLRAAVPPAPRTPPST
jgi:hypothetical protein